MNLFAGIATTRKVLTASTTSTLNTLCQAVTTDTLCCLTVHGFLLSCGISIVLGF